MRDAPPIVRTRHVSTTIRNRPTTRWLYARATAHIVTTGEALRRQLARDNGVPLDAHDVDPHRHRSRAFRSRRRRGRARAARPAAAADARHRRDAARLEGPRRSCSRRSRATAPRGAAGTCSSSATARIATASRRAARRARPRRPRRFAGQQDDVVPWLQALELFVLPSWGEEGVPQAIMQAMACGIPGRVDAGGRDHRSGRRPA